MNESLPQTPEDMPSEWDGDERAIRNCLVTLDCNSVVDIHWETDHAASARSGEPEGVWTVEIRNHAGNFVGKHGCITNALWFATTIADARWHEDYNRREAARSEALAKLSVEDRKILGL